MNKLNSYKHHSKEYLLKFGTTKLSELENIISNNKGSRLQYVSSAYLYYWKTNESLIPYPALLSIREEYAKAVNNEKSDSQYSKVLNTINNKVNKKEIDNNFKCKVIEEVNKISSNNKLNYRFISRSLNIDYSSFYKFFKYKKLSELSREKVINSLRFIKENYE